MRVCCVNCKLFGNGCENNLSLTFAEATQYYCDNFSPEKEENSIETLMSEMISILKKDK